MATGRPATRRLPCFGLFPRAGLGTLLACAFFALCHLGWAGEGAPKAPGAGGRLLDDWERGLRAELSRRVTIGFKDATAREAFRLLEASSKIRFFLEPELVESARKASVPNMKTSAEGALRALCRLFLARHALCEGIVVVVRRDSDALPATRSYDIRDLVSVPYSPGASGGLVAAGTGFARIMRAEKCRALTGTGWAVFVRASVAPETWRRATDEDAPPGWPPYIIRYRDGFLIATHTPAVHAEIEKLLTAYRRKKGWRYTQVHILARYVRVETSYLQSIRKGFKLQCLPTGGASSAASYAVLGDVTLKQLLADMAKRRKGQMLYAPRLTCFNAQRASMRLVVNYGYVRAVTSDTEPKPPGIPPGASFEVHPFVHPDRNAITIVFDSTSPWLTDDLYARGVLGCATVPDGGALLIEGFEREPRATKPPTRLVVLLTAQVVPDIFED